MEMRGLGRVRVGTSGWHYAHWVGPFYPEETRPSQMLAWYVRSFDTVEINNTFYQLPAAPTVRRWREEAPEGFVFACKASRYLTHLKKLDVSRRSIVRFFRVVELLGDRLGPILFQLPPHWHQDLERLRTFLARLPEGHRYAFEFRDETWIAPAVTDLLLAHHAACCAYEFAGRRPEVPVTADFMYVRLHGPGGAYEGRYQEATLSAWAEQIADWRRGGREVYCYFDNDEQGYAAADALRLKEKLGL
ncbi:MAG: DUF72 domain-containing protein [Acidobacteriota bacterium]|nr:DUF72 domain-containing protein [Acidobacteriota bacterium]